MNVQFSNTPYAQLTRPGPDEALRRARAALNEMAARGTVRTSSVGMRLGKLGVRYSSTSVSIDTQTRQSEASASENPAVAKTFAEPASVAQAATAQAQTTPNTTTNSAPSLYARARQRMAEALLANARENDEPQFSLDSLLRNRRGTAMYSEALRARPESGRILAFAV